MSNPLNSLLRPPPPDGPHYRWGYVTSVSPTLQVVLDTETDPIERPSALVPLEPGDRVFVLLESLRATILGKVPEPTWLTIGVEGGAFAGGWSNFDPTTFAPAAFRIEGSRVHFRGLIADGSEGIAIYLPPDVAPRRNEIFTAGANGGVVRVDVTRQGGGDAISVHSYSVGANNDYVSLSGISWDRGPF